MRQLGSEQEPTIEQMYSTSVEVQPTWNPKTRVTTGKFVDWGTKLYHLELELSYKNNEIEILKKKLKKYADELYPDGDCGKKSNIVELRKKFEASERQLIDRSQDLQAEKRRNRDLSRELAQVKKRYDSMRRRRTNNKSVQTIPDNNKGVQVPTRSLPKTRTIMTQCSAIPYRPPAPQARPVVHTDVKTEIKTNTRTGEYTRTSITRGNSTPPSNAAKKDGVKFASAVSIKDNSKPGDYDEPLEMSLLQEFTDDGVKTVVQSNKNFKIAETPVHMSRESFQAAKAGIAPIEGIPALPETVASKESLHSPADSDCGISSGRHSSGSPPNAFSLQPTMQQQQHKPSYTQILSGSQLRQSNTFGEKTYERNLPYYLNGAAGTSAYPEWNKINPTRSYPPVEVGDPRFNYSPRDFHQRNSVTSGPGAMIPYYLFRREHNGASKVKRSEKPIFVHTSEINFA